MVQQESRVKKSLLNARVNLIFYFLTLTLSFFSRKIFLDTLGADFVGLTGTLQNLLGFLNLAELGIGSAIGYILYKPLFDHDEIKINEIISVFGYLYRWIGKIILLVGCGLACFLPLIFPNTRFELGFIFFAYFSFLISALIGYFINYRQVLLGADQKNYVVTAYFQGTSLLKVLIQLFLAYYTANYYLWIVIELLFGVLYSLILNKKIEQVYPWLRSDLKKGKAGLKKYPEVMKYTKQLFVHKMATFVQFQTLPLLVYTFVSLQMVAYYGNYTIITEKLNLLLNSFLGSTGAGVGNLIAEKKLEKILQVFWELMAIRFFIASIFIIAIYELLPAFIILWLGEQYLLSETVLILILYTLFVTVIRGSTDQFLFGYGLFSDVWAPLVESIVYIIVAFIGGFYWGLEGVLLGSVVSLSIIVCGWKPYFLFTRGFHLSVFVYWSNWIKYLFLSIIAFMFVVWGSSRMRLMEYILISWSHWVIGAIIIVVVSSLTLFLILYVGTKGMRDFVKRIIKK